MQEEQKQGEELLTPDDSHDGYEMKQRELSKIEDYPQTAKTTYEQEFGHNSGYKTSSKAGYPSTVEDPVRAPAMIVEEVEESPVVQDGREGEGRRVANSSAVQTRQNTQVSEFR